MRTLISLFLIILSFCSCTVKNPSHDNKTKPFASNVNGEISRIYEYNHEYHQCLVYKVLNDIPEDGEKLEIDFDESLEMIRTIHDITGGIKQIIYFVGWQFDGHDSKYPAWSEVNHRLKRSGDTDARASFIRLAEEARQYNAYVSIHINMSDAYKNSPLWDIYLKNDLIVRNPDGSIKEGMVWGGEISHFVDKVKEWDKGFAQKRIDGLLEILPFIKENGTVHIDAFGLVRDNEKKYKTVCNIFDYWKKNGVDVTTEYADMQLMGRIPMVWHLNLAEENRLKYPPSLICGGGSIGNMRNPEDRVYTHAGWAMMPDAGCFYEEAWGASIDSDFTERQGKLKNIVHKFCTKTLVWYFLNQYRPISHFQDLENYTVTFTGGVVSNVRKSDRHLTIKQAERLFVDGDNIFIPAPWTDGEWFAYNKGDEAYKWAIPKEWKGVNEVNAVRITDRGRTESTVLNVVDGEILIEPTDGEALAISQKRE
ncbi:endo-alpha-N-acetylgalactosaminidase family protein [uncultured Draconibacterium sp.]|uniref:endo-alpha-N-acetylgalactosaminidase family protein n=1 Tax=uncultured Draconibacterium sp. TaxID=1573823 RepID=UPI0025D5F9E6|nr:endo-alpha-N-acetylgalactosaminidase family protein [uncultured Draconibacterium sp.]